MATSYFSDVEPQDSPLGPQAPGEDSPLADEDAEIDAAFLAAPKKPVNKNAILLFTIIILGGTGMYAMWRHSGPSSAAAAAPVEDAQVGQFLSDGGRSVHQLVTLLDSTKRVVEQFNHFTDTPQVPLKELKYNPFRLAAATALPDTEESTRQKREAERQAALKAVQALSLQSIVCSPSSRQCMINNTLYAEGQEVNGFVIEKVTPTYVVVRIGAFKFELKMQK
jgi:hypothetical protein